MRALLLREQRKKRTCGQNGGSGVSGAELSSSTDRSWVGGHSWVAGGGPGCVFGSLLTGIILMSIFSLINFLKDNSQKAKKFTICAVIPYPIGSFFPEARSRCVAQPGLKLRQYSCLHASSAGITGVHCYTQLP